MSYVDPRAAPDRYAVMGNPVGHSKSPLIHAEFARQTGQRLFYTAILAPIGDFARVARSFGTGGGRGLNVTLPFKEEAFRLADRHTERASQAGAANTLAFGPEGILADNTDGAGLLADLTRNLGFEPRGQDVLLVGAGGAARAVVPALLAAGPASLVIANRSPDRATALARDFATLGPVEARSLAGLKGRHFRLLINATSAGLSGQAPELPQGIVDAGALAYDMVYGRDETPFLAWARGQGATRVADGLGMLVEQAAESFFLWRGVRPDTASVIEQLRRS